jgi:tripartite motif-containing protein 71
MNLENLYPYWLDSGDNRIQEFDSNGKFIRTWGSFGTVDGQFNGPLGITLDYTQGYVYVTDTGNQRVEKFDGNGTFITSWGSFGTGAGQFNTPIGIDEDEAKHVRNRCW